MNHKLLPINSKTPAILFVTFNRIECTKVVFEEIKKARPKNLYISSDNVKNGVSNEKVIKIRNYLINSIDWDCNLKTLFYEENQGCKNGPQNAITWFFEHEDYGVILEDDCIPSQSFFSYTSQLLSLYQNDLRVFGICGTNLQYEKLNLKNSYFFSKYFSPWGWATWSDRWSRHLNILKDFERFLKDPLINDITQYRKANFHLINMARESVLGDVECWDYQWLLSCLLNNSLFIAPEKNLIQNIGFNEFATHSKQAMGRQVKEKDINFPLNHPDIVLPNSEIDAHFLRDFLNIPRQ